MDLRERKRGMKNKYENPDNLCPQLAFGTVMTSRRMIGPGGGRACNTH
jgi:hypothetical protein